MLIGYGTASDQTGGTRDSACDLQLAIPALGIDRVERLLEQGHPSSGAGCLRIYRSGEFKIGTAQVPVEPNTVRSASYRIYNDVFEAFRGLNLYRIWNYAPAINEGEGDLENYRQFCLGRSEAFEQEYGAIVDRFMPAGTCVGCDGDKLVVVVIGGEREPDHFENPKQIPAYQYPREYGPRAPSFARASSVCTGDCRYRFISGTAAVLGHESVGAGSLDEQLAVTCDNLDTIIAETLDSKVTDFEGRRSSATGKVYLRHASDYPKAKSYFEERFPNWSEGLIYLRSDICRRELLVEAELSFVDGA